MSEKWEWVTLDKLGKLSSGKPFSKKYKFNPKLHKKSIPFIGVKEVCRSKLHILKSDRYYSLNSLIEGKNKLFPKNTVCITYRGSTGDAALLKNDSFLSWSLHGFLANINISDPKFVKYCFNFQNLKTKLIALSKLQTVQPNLTLTKLFRIKFPKPPLEVQKKIGDILANYDLILDNHEKQIELLKKLKKSLFKEWFIKLRFPNYENYTIRGGLPEGWTIVKVWEISKIFKGSKPASHANLLEGGGQYPFFTSSFKTKKSYTFSYDLFALLVSEGGSTFHAKIYKGKFEASNHTYVIDLENKEKIYLVLEFLNNIHLPRLNWLTYATTFLKNLSPKKLKEIEILIPDQKILEKFNNFWKNIHSKIEKLEQKIEKYEKIKKNLLDSLFSQEIQVY